MANNYPIIDGDGFTKTFKTTETGGVHTVHHNIDSMPNVAVTAFPIQHIDSFSRVRTAEPGYRFDSQLTYQIDSDSWDTRVFLDAATGTAADGVIAHDPVDRLATLTTKLGGVGVVRLAVLQAHYHSPYTSGRGQLALVTGVIGAAPVAGGEVGMGYFDGVNGAYLRRDSVGVYVGIETTTTAGNQEVIQASWNIDPMDGTGPSGITLDLTKSQILAIPLQALYVGRAILAFDINGELYPVHQFLHANVFAAPYIAQASLPIRYWSKATNTASDVVMRAICCSVISEGGADLQDIPGRQFVASGTLTDASPKVAVLAIRCKSQLNSINQNALCIPTEVDVAIASAGAWIEVRRNAAITAGLFADVDGNSVMEFSNPQSVPALVVTADTGTLIDKFYVPAAAQSRASDSAGLLGKALMAYSHLLAVADNLVVIIDGGNNTDAFVSIKWKEIR